MLQALEAILLKISWLPGMGWLETYVNQLYFMEGIFDQKAGKVKVRAKQYKSIVTNPLGKDENSEEPSNPGDADPENTASTKAGMTDAPNAKKLSVSPLTATGSGVPPSYRAQRAAARASFLMFLFLICMVGTVWTLFVIDPKNVPWRHSMSWWRITMQVVLVFAIPVITHRVVRLWLEGDLAKYPDVDYAWNHGMFALRNVGVNIDSVPLFLMIGSGDDQHELAMMGASRLEFRAAATPEGPAALHWYVTPAAVYLFATDVGWISAMSALAAKATETGEGLVSLVMPSDAITFNPPSSTASAVEGTIMASDWQAQASAKPVTTLNGPSAVESQGTIMLDAALASSNVSDDLDQPTSWPKAGRPYQLSSGESSAAIDRLRYLSSLIRSVRGSLCPLNGIVVLLSSRMLNSSDDEINEISKAISTDLETLSHELQLRCPVSAMVTGMENEPGFQEFIRRVGSDRSVWQRFGKKFEPDTENTRDELRSFGSHVIGAFEDWIYTLFRERESLSKPGNTHLYELLCNVRCSMKIRLEQILISAFSSENHPLLFSGCYFSATGSTADQQGFVRGFMDKLIDEQELLEWTKLAKTEDKRIRWLSRLGWLTCLVGIAAILWMVGRIWPSWW